MSEREEKYKEISKRFKKENPEIAKAMKLLNMSLSEYFDSLSSSQHGIPSSGDTSGEAT